MSRNWNDRYILGEEPLDADPQDPWSTLPLVQTTSLSCSGVISRIFISLVKDESWSSNLKCRFISMRAFSRKRWLRYYHIDSCLLQISLSPPAEVLRSLNFNGRLIILVEVKQTLFLRCWWHHYHAVTWLWELFMCLVMAGLVSSETAGECQRVITPFEFTKVHFNDLFIVMCGKKGPPTLTFQCLTQ